MEVCQILGSQPKPEEYQGHLLYNDYLPYHNLLHDEAEEWIKQIKTNLARAVMLRELRPGVVIWMSRLTSYINLYGYRFSKKDHLGFINVAWELLTSPGQETRLMETFVKVLLCLLKRKDLLSPADLVLPWRPLYAIFEDLSSHLVVMNLRGYPPDFGKNLKNLVRLCRYYFPPSATQEILDEFRPYFCPHDSIMTQALSFCNLFLPTLHVRQDEAGAWRRVEPAPYLCWMQELLGFWSACSNNPPWEGSLVSLLARLAADNVGCIDWAKVSPVFFQKCMQSFNLPVYYKRLGVSLKPSQITNSSITKWIVSTITKDSSTLSLLSGLLGAVNSYYHPTSTGPYSDKIIEFINKLVYGFMTRLSRERYDLASPVLWLPATRPEDRLTDAQVEELCRIVLPANLNLATSRKYVDIERINLSILAHMRPDIIVPPLIRMLDLSLETLTEPFKFTAAVKCVVAVSRNLVRSDPRLPEGQDHVLRILFSVLPGIDCNDIKKTLTVFQLISVFARLVPFKTISSNSKLKMKSMKKHSFHEFVSIYMEKCFSLIENSSLEVIRQEQSTSDAHMSSEESSINIGIVTCFDSILHQADTDIQQLAIGKLEEYLRGRILEPKVAGKIASGMCRTCAKISPERILGSQVPSVCKTLVSTFGEADLESDLYLGDEIMFNLLLLSDLVCVPGFYLLPFRDQISEVVEIGLSIRNREGHAAVLTVLRHVLHALSHPCLKDRTGIVAEPSDNPLNDWGKPGDLENLNIQWYLPGNDEFAMAEQLGTLFLGTQVDKLNQFIDCKVVLEKEEVQKCLKTISTIIIGCSPYLPAWSEEPVYLSDTKVENIPRKHTISTASRSFRFRGVANTRAFLVDLMDKLLKKVLEDRADDTKVLISLATILKLIVFQHTCTDEGLDKHVKGFQQSKCRLECKLAAKEKHIRAILVERVLIQHEKRLVENIHTSLTDTHIRVMHLLLDLAMSHYSRVRTHAQNILAKICKWFSYSYKIIVPRVLSKLHFDPLISHEEFKGALYLILQNQLLVKHNWQLQAELWPLLVQAQHNEKPSITALIKSITAYIHSIDNWTIKWTDLSPPALASAGKLTGSLPSAEEVEAAVECRKAQGQENLRNYLLLADKLCDKVDSSDLHWRHYNTALSMLCALLRHDIDFPLRAVKIFTENIIHEDVLVRKASIHVLDCILKKTKRKHPKISVPLQAVDTALGAQLSLKKLISEGEAKNSMNGCEIGDSISACSQNPISNFEKDVTSNGCETSPVGQTKSSEESAINHEILGNQGCEEMIELNSCCAEGGGKGAVLVPADQDQDLLVKPGERVDNMFLQYSDNNKPLSSEQYDAPRFIHKTHFGFYVWPKENLVYAPSSEQPKLDRTPDEMSPSEQIIYSFFTDNQNIKKLFSFLTLEQKKGFDFFDVERFGMFKALFRNFGDLFLEDFRTELNTMVGDHRESVQRAAAELMASIIRGSKHWPYEKIDKLWSWLLPAIRTALNNVSPETQRDWGTCFATSSDNRDPNKLHWLMEVAMEDPIRSQGSFIDASRLYMLQGVVAQQRWRVGELLHRLLEFLIPYLDHPFHNVRSRLGAVLTNIFALDIHFGELGNASLSSPVEKDFVQLILPRLQPLQSDDEKDENALRLLQTVSKWICCGLTQNLGLMKAHTLDFVPYLLQYEWYDRDPQLARDCQLSLSYMSRSPLRVELLQPVFQMLQKILLSASWRTKLSTLDFLQAVVFNNFISILDSSDRTKEIVLDIVNQGLVDEQLEVRVKASQVLSGLIHCKFIPESRIPALILEFKQSFAKSGTSVPVRHGAVLGLCSFISAFPHEVPGFLPNLLIYLGSLLNQKQPVSGTIKKTVQSFKRTHQDNWIENKTMFTEDQLTDLTNLLISPSYYA